MARRQAQPAAANSKQAALRQTITSPARYIGMIGSRAKCQTILDRLRADGYADEALARVYAPIGPDLGGPTPQEIAVRRRGSGAMRSR